MPDTRLVDAAPVEGSMAGTAVAEDPELVRLRSLRRLQLLDTGPEERFDRVVRVARHLFDVPMAAVNLVDEDRQWTKAGVGIAVRELPRSMTLCSRVTALDDTLVVPDATRDDQARDTPLVTGPAGVRFYAGHPLHAPDGEAVGTLCILDQRPREFGPDQRRMLRDLAAWVEKELAIDDELIAAANVQRRLFPSTPPDVAGYDVAGACLPARDIGGDFFDWHWVGDELQLVVGDVMGKGFAAALIAASTRVLLRGASQYNELASAVTRSAFVLEPDLAEAQSFVTAFCLRLDPPTGRVEYVDVGHGLAVVMDDRGRVRRLLGDGLPMGALPDEAWREQTDALAPGETLMVVSDGLLDFFDTPADALAAAQGVRDRSDDASAMVREIIDAAARSHLEDDATIVVVRREADS